MTLPSDWEEQLKNSLRTAEDLRKTGFIGQSEIGRYETLLRKYKFLLTPYYASLIDKDDPRCPIRRQAIPSLEEWQSTESFSNDPLNDLEHQPARRVTHRYKNRALLHLTPNCSMYCRFCFRKSLLNELSQNLFKGPLAEAMSYFITHPEVEEVIFSGGDPFMTSDDLLSSVVDSLSTIPSVRRIRFHTRVPVTLPSRVTTTLAQALSSTRLGATVVTHFNHPKEITSQSTLAVKQLKDCGISVLNQSVLLQGVNDDSDTLSQLMLALDGIGVLPYYLHHPDRAEGTSHFDVSYERGLEIHDRMKARLPGYLLPKYVVDLPEYDYKVEVAVVVAVPPQIR